MRPDPTTYNPDPGYVRELLARAGLSQRKAALLCHVSERTMKNWCAGTHPITYTAQYTLEQAGR